MLFEFIILGICFALFLKILCLESDIESLETQLLEKSL
jgi:hypothetical protein